MTSYKIASAKEAAVFPIACAFVDKYMPAANATFVKVYLYGLRQCYQSTPRCDISAVSAALDILESDVIRAWKYWESVGIVSLIPSSETDSSNFGIEFVDLTMSVMPSEDKRPDYSFKEIAKQQELNKELKEMYHHAQTLLGKTLSQNDILALYSFYDWLSLPVEVILMIVEYCASLGKRSMRYIEAVASSWSDLGINTAEKANSHLLALEKNGRAKRKYKKMLGFNDRDLSDAEYSHLVEWSENLGFSDDLIKLAYEKTVLKTGKVSFSYMNAILQDWYKNSIKTVEQVATEDKRRHPAAKTNLPRTKFSAYSEKGNYDIDEIERLLMEKRFAKEEGK